MNTTWSGFSQFDYYNEHLTVGEIIFNLVLSLPLNGYVMWLILRRQTLASDFFSLNLAVSEVLFTVFSVFYLLFVCLKQFFYFEIFLFSIGLIYTARPLFQCCVCVECYLGVVHPVFFLRYKPLRYRVRCCCVAWLISMFFCFYSKYTYRRVLYFYAFFIQNVFFMFVCCYCSVHTAWVLKQSGPGEKVRKQANTMKRKAFKIILLVMTSMAINFFLCLAVIPLQCCLPPNVFFNTLTVCTGLGLVTGFVQPLLYLHRNGNLVCFREF